MIHTIVNVVYVLIAIAMIALILLQRGAGAQAGSGFGAGASATVFGARGSANFLSSATKWLAVVFFGLSLYMAWQASHDARVGAGPSSDAGIMNELPTAPAPAAGEPAAALPTTAPAAPTTAPATAPATTPEAERVIAPATPVTPQPEPAPVEPAKGG